MNIVFLTTEIPPRFYLINHINDRHRIAKVFFQTKYPEPPSWKLRVAKLLHSPTKIRNIRYVCREFAEKLLFAKEHQLKAAYEAKKLFNNSVPHLAESIAFERVYSMNSESTHEKVQKESPDLICIYGTEILKGEILHAARIQILNIHPGILPKYRGGGVPLWCFYNNDFDNLGVTIHVCTEALDGGDIVAQRFLPLSKDDTIYSLESRTAMLAVDLLDEVLNKYKSGTISYRKQEQSTLWTDRELSITKRIAARSNFAKYVRSLRA